MLGSCGMHWYGFGHTQISVGHWRTSTNFYHNHTIPYHGNFCLIFTYPKHAAGGVGALTNKSKTSVCYAFAATCISSLKYSEEIRRKGWWGGGGFPPFFLHRPCIYEPANPAFYSFQKRWVGTVWAKRHIPLICTVREAPGYLRDAQPVNTKSHTDTEAHTRGSHTRKGVRYKHRHRGTDTRKGVRYATKSVLHCWVVIQRKNSTAKSMVAASTGRVRTCVVEHGGC